MLIVFQKFLADFFHSLLSVMKIIILSKFSITLPKAVSNKECVILANGPSLKESLLKHYEFMKEREVICVNHFVLSDFYIQLMPKYYVLAAPEFYMENAPTEMHKNQRLELFERLNKLTTREMYLFIPSPASKSTYFKNAIQNKNIKIVYYNTTPVEGIKNVTHYLFSKNLGMPRPHNVLVPSIFLAINMEFKKIYLFGADHSWHEELQFDENNSVIINHNHFYDEENKKIQSLYHLDGRKYFIHDFFKKMYLSFKGYHILNDYAVSLNKEIINVSSKSYIDAFKRKINF